MTMQNAQDNTALFSSGRPLHREEATKSWWLDVQTRDEFNAAVVRESLRMARSREAKHVNGVTVGCGSARKGIR
jgi:hypothetical protein